MKVYVATLSDKMLGVFTSPHLASSSRAVTGGAGVRTEETSWGWAIVTKNGVVELREVETDPK